MRKCLCCLLVCVLLFAPAAFADQESALSDAAAAIALLPENERVINIYTWTYYIPDEVVDAFREATGATVNYAPFSENEEMLSKLQAVSGQFDLIVCSDYVIPTLIENGLAEKIDYGALSNAGNIDPAFQSQYYDPENAYTIPYTNTVPLIVYDPDAVSIEIHGYKDLWDESLRGSLVLLNDMRNVIGMAAKALGYGFNETDPEHLAEIKDYLMKLKPNVVVYNADTPHNALLGGDAVAGFMFGSQIEAALLDMPNLKTVYPDEGIGFGIDNILIPKDAPHADATYIFLNYLLDGEVSAQASELINYGSCNTAAQAYLSPEFKAKTTVNAPADALAGAEMVQPLDAETLKIYDEIWTEVRK